MSDSRAALDMDRLPWLTDERKPSRRGSSFGPLLPWALLGALVLAAASYWLGMKSVTVQEPPQYRMPSEATVTLPGAAQEQAPPEEAQPSPVPPLEALPPPPPMVRMSAESAEPRAEPKPAPRTAPPAERTAAAEAAPEQKDAQAEQPAVVEKPRELAYWPASESTGASGRIVRIGTFASRRQAKKAWWKIVQHYPGMKRLNAVVVGAPSLRNNRTFYRLQFGTTSQAHSEILCQRMRIVGQSCIVVGIAPGQKA